MQNYINAICTLGSAYGYNTDFSERLHIDYAKEGYCASNKQEYVEQMALWLQHQEAIDFHSVYLTWTHAKVKSIPLLSNGGFEADNFLEYAAPDNDDDGHVYHVAKNSPLPHHPLLTWRMHSALSTFFPHSLHFWKRTSWSPATFIWPSTMDHFDV